MAEASPRQDDEQFIQYMRQALELAERGTALASPNPRVGAVIVRDGAVVGTGFHTYDEKKHAEVRAIEAAGERANGATLFLNLEPCCHTGRTGPCTQAILRAGISKVVAAMLDPNPTVAGKGFEELRAGGASVEVGVCREEAERLNEAFAKHIRTGLPLVTLKTAMTLDGKIAAPENNSGWVTSEPARAYVQRQRHACDAILTGIGTVLADDPLLTDRTGLTRRRPLLRVLMDSRLRIPLSARMLQEVHQDLLIFCSASSDSSKRGELERRGVCVSTLPGVRPDIREVVKEIGRREMNHVLLEAGADLNAATLRAGIVDKVFLYYAPKIVGGDALPMAADIGVRAMKDALRVSNIRHHQFQEDFAVEGYLRDVYRNH